MASPRFVIEFSDGRWEATFECGPYVAGPVHGQSYHHALNVLTHDWPNLLVGFLADATKGKDA